MNKVSEVIWSDIAAKRWIMTDVAALGTLSFLREGRTNKREAVQNVHR